MVEQRPAARAERQRQRQVPCPTVRSAQLEREHASARGASLAGGSLIGSGPFLGLASGISWGAGDFAGGLIARYSSAFLAVVISQAVGLTGTLVLLGLTGEQMPDGQSILWAAAAGASGLIGIGAFYHALSRGTMGVIAPLAALIGAGVPVIVDLAGGGEMPVARLAGIVIALVAVVLISLPGGEHPGDERRRLRLDIAELPYVITSGLGFAGFFLCIDQATAGGATWWPLAVVRIVGLGLVVGVVAILAARSHGGHRRGPARVLGLDRLRAHAPHPVVMLAVLAITGAGDLGGNAFFVLASQAGAFAVAVILSSLYPVVTTVLAALFLHERMRRVQLLGVALATASVVLLR